MIQQIAATLIVTASAGWIGLRIWRWTSKRRSQKTGGCGGCTKCGGG
ncbi:MAG: hypothetical protein Q7R40_00635 [Phaeospirillum sp.]|nr:hypothetical protein [Phaeospirillum sp.]